ncbi:MAG: C1 family peptidase [Marinifilaceae bacterium]|jgi:bleomycin hydrolase|nr:C1 family peptidase [Marinifilaceae bacterium]
MRLIKLTAFALIACMLLPTSTFARKKKKVKKEAYVFTDIKRLPTTSVKNQYRAGTCWSWSTLSFMESEMIKMGKKPVDLSAIFVANRAYKDKGEKYVRLHGDLNFGAGGANVDILHVIKKYGIVPKSVYEGLNYGESNHVQGELDAVLKAYLDGVVKNRNRRLSTAWMKGFEGILSAYYGEIPATFSFEGKQYTPQSFAKERVGLNMDDYVLLTSFTHHPFYKTFAMEVQDNWLWGQMYNLPIDELMQVMNSAIDNGYTIAWASDVSEKGFRSSKGYAIVPLSSNKELADLEMGKWEKMSKRKKKAEKAALKFKELPVTQEMRQEAFDRWETTDDHGMHIVGTAKDQRGAKYFIVKNSWGEYGKYKGYFYASETFVKYKTMNIMINKNAIPAAIRAKLGL